MTQLAKESLIVPKGRVVYVKLESAPVVAQPSARPTVRATA
jgi:hypothetical protein